MSLGINSDIRNGHWLGEVVDNKDPLKNGRCRVRVFGKFDSLPNESVPWASAGNRSGAGQHTVPVIGEIVEVTFDNGNIYAPVYGEIVNQNKNLKDKVIGKEEESSQVNSIVFDVNRKFVLTYSIELGFCIGTNADAESQAMIRFDKDGKIFLYADNIFVSKDMNDESEPTAKGETLRKMLEDFIIEITKHKHTTPSGLSNFPINKADFDLIKDDLETIKHVGGVQPVQMTEEEIAAADNASLSGESIASSTLSVLGGNTKPDPDASKKLQKQIDSYDDKSITVKSGTKKAKSVPQSLIKAMKAYGIVTPLQRAHFLAQCAHESGEFKWREEFASGSAYEGRKDLGNTQPGDGVKFKGRGFVQITGRANYKQFSKYCGEDLTINPKNLATKYAADTATWFWQTRNLNKYAVDDSLASIKAITRRINGGFNGLQDRVNRFQDYWAILKDNPSAFT
jgi:predicted chitinase